ncbi:MAG: DUF4358 domain-containing protein [Oscillospiraceae bacterium]|nr:DUF4358 domain-containing protein [Oscillospiraceae bacterium]
MKKLLLLPISALILIAVAGCGGGAPADTNDSNLNGAPAEILGELADMIQTDAPATFDSAITADNCKGLGLTSEEFDKYVSDAVLSTAAISTFAHEVALFSAKDPASALEIKKLIAANYDSNKWICVFPEKSCVTDSGNYVLLAVGRSEYIDALTAAFSELAGTTGEIDVFFSGPAGGVSPGGPGGLLLPG